EGERLDRQEHRGPLHPALLPARAEPHPSVMSAPAKASRPPRPGPGDLASRKVRVVTELPGPRAREMIASAMTVMSPSLIHVYPLMVERAAGCMVEDVDGNVFLDCQAGVA